jgi:erythronate-4-phosphate dehydrogenase
MKIIADENIPCVSEAFASLGDVMPVSGRGLQAEQVKEADILLVRSVTRVDEALLAGSSVRFVGSATIGFDHVDRDYLGAQGIGFATAPGSNATSAAEYVVSSLMVLAEQQDLELAGRTVGIIGCGNVGSRVRERLTALGMQCHVNDPPLREAGVDDDFVDLTTVLQSDVVTVHVPFSRHGAHPTFHLLDARVFNQLRPGTILVNTSRGAVADNTALNDILAARGDLTVVLDVWEGEPSINLSLLEKVALGTPHIAGYSLDGKLRGTEMIYRAACEFLGAQVQWDVSTALPADPAVSLPEGMEDGALLRAAVLGCYDVRADDRRLRRLSELTADEQPRYFDRLRKEYPVRREFAATRLTGASIPDRIREQLAGLGFTV